MNQRRTITATVWSGLCNRLFVISSALRLAEASDRDLHVYWLSRTGRAAMEYEGEEDALFEEMFDPDIDSLISITYVPVPPAMPPGTPGLDYQAGFDLPVGKGMQVPDEVVALLTSPRILDLQDPAVESADDVWIHLSTMPVGTPADGMERHLNYFLPPGIHQKDRFFKSLSDYARRIRLAAPIRAEVDTLVAAMRDKAGGAPLVGIHIRGTDRDQRTDVSREDALNRIVTSLLSRPDRTPQIYLASDDQGEIDRVTRQAERAGVADAITMYDNPVKFENSAAGTRAALIDLYALAACDVIYGTAASSFSLYAWMLSSANFHIHS